MNEIARRAALAVILVSAASAPAVADGSADLQMKVDGALKSAKSFVVTTRYPAQNYSATLVYVAPDRSRATVAVNANTTDVVTVGQTIYSSKNGAPFEKSALPAETGPRPPGPGSVKVTAVHADITSAGTTYGAFVTVVPLGTLVSLTCTYQKKTYRLVRCANEDVSQTYEGYNDPANVVDVPQNAIDAPPTAAPRGAK